MTLYLIQWLTLILTFSIAIIAPGPDFVMAVRNSVIYSRRAGIFTSIGFGLGVLVHVSYTAFGISAIIAQSVMLFNIIKWAGAAYLLFIGIKSLRSTGMNKDILKQSASDEPQEKSLKDVNAIRMGFLTNLLNPKATLFFLAIFSQIISVQTPPIWYVIYGLTCSVMCMLWFIMVAVVLTYEPIRNQFLKVSKWIDRTCGALLILLGIKVALATK